MLQATLIGNLGATAEVKVKDGREFITFRVAHNENYTDNQGQKVEKSMWVDCIMNCVDGKRPAILPYLQGGTLVMIQGSITTRIYSSEKDRCMKAGITVHVQAIQLLGGQQDSVPRRLYTPDGLMIDVAKHYHVQASAGYLLDRGGRRYLVDKKGWCIPEPSNDQPNTDSNDGK